MRKQIICKALAAAAVLLGYYVFVRLTGVMIPCMYRRITGLKCPGCGITRMLLHAARLEFAEAFKSNPAMFVTVPCLLILLAVKIVFMPEWLSQRNAAFKRGIIALCVLLIGFGAVRNIVGL